MIIALCLAVGYRLIRWNVLASAPGTLQRAERLIRQRENTEARETLKWLLWFEPRQYKALLITGVSLNAEKRFSEAIEVLERIPENSVSFEQGGIALAASLVLDGQLDRAEFVFKQQLARYPQSIDAHNRLVLLYLRQLRKRNANELLIDRWRRYPDDLSVLPDLLGLKVKPVTPQGRVEFLEDADNKHPNQASVVLALARAYSQMGMTEQARNRIQSALELRPNDSETKIFAAEFYLEIGELEMVRSLLDINLGDASSADYINDDRYWFARCRVAEQSGNVREAYDHLLKVMELRPKEETYILMQAALLRQLGQVDAAAQAAREATRLAEDRKHLMVLSDKFDRNRPDQTQCLAIAELLERLGHPMQAADWRRVSKAISHFNPAGVSAPTTPVQFGPKQNSDL